MFQDSGRSSGGDVENAKSIGQVVRGGEGAGGGHFVLLLCGRNGGHGDVGASLLLNEADDWGEPVGDGLSVERSGELAVQGL